MMELYQCSKCKKMKWEDEMSLNYSSKMKDGTVTISQSLCRNCRLEVQREYRESNRQKLREFSQRYHREIKLKALRHYSKNGSEPVCKECGFSDIRALSIDHILGGGAQHRLKVGVKTGTHFYHWLKKQGYPEGYQVLCMNCQFIKRHTNKEWR